MYFFCQLQPFFFLNKIPNLVSTNMTNNFSSHCLVWLYQGDNGTRFKTPSLCFCIFIESFPPLG